MTGAGTARGSLRAAPARPRPDESGSVTAEGSVVIPLLVLLTLGLVWLVALGATQVRVVDAARETARAIAREEPRATAVALGERVAPESARFAVEAEEETVRVTVTAPVRGPGGLFAFLPSVEVEADAVTAKEPK